MDKINTQLYHANIDLVDKNKVLEEDKKILQKRINRAIEYIQDRYDGEVLTHTFDKCNVGELLEILKGRYVREEN